MNNPFFWLGLSILLVAISLMALLVVAVFTLQELARAARSAEKLLDTLNREMPATLQDLRLTGKEIAVLSDEVSGGMQSARSVVSQVDQSLIEAKAHAQKARVTTRSFVAGATAALRVLTGKPRRRRSRPPTRRPPIEVTQQSAKAPPPANPPADPPANSPADPPANSPAGPATSQAAALSQDDQHPQNQQRQSIAPSSVPSVHQPTPPTAPSSLKPAVSDDSPSTSASTLSDTIPPTISESTARK